MALTSTDKGEVERIVKKEIKDFLGSNTINQYEKKIIDKIKKEIKNGSISGDVSNVVARVMKEFYKIMWTRRSFWEPTIRNVK